ncbi:histone H2A [Nematocida homosporus]|uniref:histone H2A n=1 Tax=Nematocida homosporus TaxID=1912981 RepID=UPI00221EF23F|nr:histone H2A [Nematocida homosporus]KAI5185413.1 histone H2A [Nematocida homosporus]
MGTGKGKKDPASAKKTSNSSKVIFKPAQLHRILRDKTKMRVSHKAIIAIAALLEYVLGEIIEAAKLICDEENKRKIVSKHISLAIRKDEELNNLGRHWLIKEGGVCPTAQMESSKSKSEKAKTTQEL